MLKSDIRASINGRPITELVPNQAVLSDLLRDQLGLTGTKVSCGMQVCGACTVLVDGKPVSACTYLAADVDGRHVETIEGLSDGDSLHALQDAFVKHGALQCGYCTPGFIMAAKALLADIPDPSDDQIRHALEGNICRCTGYLPIIDAVKDAARALRDEAVEGPETLLSQRILSKDAVAGDSVERVDAVAKVTGAAQYAVDTRLPNMLEGCVVRADRAHARLLRVQSDQAMKVKGCVAVITGADLQGLYPRFGHIVPDHQILVVDKVRYYGEPVALVLAEDIYTAREAAALIEVEYEDLPSVLDSAAALADDAPLIHGGIDYSVEPGARMDGPQSGNVAVEERVEWGDVDTALAEAHTVVETRTHHPMLYAYAMEPYNAIAQFVDGNLDIVSTAQHPYMVAQDVARVFDMPLSKVRISAPFIGGGYGSKSYTKIEPLVAIGAWYTRRPVKVVLDISESIYTTRADSADVVVRSGFDADGRIVARDFDVILNTGAYADNSPTVLQKAVHRCFGPYKIPNLRVRGRAVYTNTSPASSYRALGAFQTNLAGETNIDQAAERLGLDPAKLRRLNLVRMGEIFIPGKRAMNSDLVADFDEMVGRLAATDTASFDRSVGFGCGANEGGSTPISVAHVRIMSDGSAAVLSAAAEMGQGSRTVLSQIAAQELGLPLESLRITQSDTASTPYNPSTGGSRTTTVAGLAVYRACHDALLKLRTMAAETWACEVEEVSASGGKIHGPGKEAGYAEVILKWFGARGGEAVGIGIVRKAGEFAESPVFWEVGMAGVEINIDKDTGKIGIDKLVTIGDVGYAINPHAVEGQDLGAATQGIGGALFEELVYDGDQIINANMIEYRVPRITDAPKIFDSFIAERGDGPGPYGAKGVGEGARIPVGGAVASAVARVTGTWPDRLPLTPERVWRLIEKKNREADSA